MDHHIFQSALDECVRNSHIEVEKDKVKVRTTEGTAGKVVGEDEGIILKTLLKYGLTPPGLKELSTETGKKEKDLRDILNRLSFEGKVVKIKGDMYFHRDAIDDLKQKAIVISHGKKRNDAVRF